MANGMAPHGQKRLLETGKAFPLILRVIGVSSISTSGLIQLLAAMIVEVIDADNRQNCRSGY